MTEPRRPLPHNGAEPDRWALPPLTLDDRCDWPHCGAPALLRIVMAAGDLYVCTHHYLPHRVELSLVAVYVQDERIAPTPDMEGMEELGRMHMRRGLTHADPCRWCTQRLVNRRIYDKTVGVFREYFVCPVCDETAADMESLKGLNFDE